MLSSLPDLMMEPVVRAALLEDLGRAGDVTSAALIPSAHQWKAALVARQDGVVAGLDLARLAFTLFDPETRFAATASDGAGVRAGEVLARMEGRARSLLTAERTALNFLSHLSGIASLTRRFVEAARPHKARICATRKTTPGLRMLEKRAVQAGGGDPHRYGLDDAILIKDNHLAVVGGVEAAVLKAREVAGHMLKVELEVDTLDQLREALSLPIDAVLLDNMTPAQLAEAAQMVAGRFLTEASGRVSLENVASIAASGVDIISVGALTHSAGILDVGMD